MLLKEYHEFYLKIYVLLLPCVLESFRKRTHRFFQISFCSLFISSRLQLLRFTNVNLKLIFDTEKQQFIESMISRSISTICKDFAEANNKFLKSYHASKPNSYIIYVEALNFYGHFMMQLFPSEVLRWVYPKDF